jgi:hypothetical protein
MKPVGRNLKGLYQTRQVVNGEEGLGSANRTGPEEVAQCCA